MLSRDLLSTQRGCTRPQRGHHRGKRQKDKALTPNKPEGPQELGFRNEATHREALHGRDAAGVSPPPSCGWSRKESPSYQFRDTNHRRLQGAIPEENSSFSKDLFFFFLNCTGVLVAAFRFFSSGMWELLP